jgi:hypothetical protein
VRPREGGEQVCERCPRGREEARILVHTLHIDPPLGALLRFGRRRLFLRRHRVGGVWVGLGAAPSAPGNSRSLLGFSGSPSRLVAGIGQTPFMRHRSQVPRGGTARLRPTDRVMSRPRGDRTTMRCPRCDGPPRPSPRYAFGSSSNLPPSRSSCSNLSHRPTLQTSCVLSHSRRPPRGCPCASVGSNA